MSFVVCSFLKQNNFRLVPGWEKGNNSYQPIFEPKYESKRIGGLTCQILKNLYNDQPWKTHKKQDEILKTGALKLVVHKMYETRTLNAYVWTIKKY